MGSVKPGATRRSVQKTAQDDGGLGQVRHVTRVKRQPGGKLLPNAAGQSVNTRTDPGGRLRRELTDAEWQLIKNSLAAVGKDADQLTLPMFKGKPLLRTALPIIAEEHVLVARWVKQAPMVKQTAAQMQETLRIATGLLERLTERSNYDWVIPRFRQMCIEASQAPPELLVQLKDFIAGLEGALEVMAVIEPFDSRRRKNALKVHTEFWRGLTYLWKSFEPNAGRSKRRHLQRFLFDCSKPFFPDVTESKIAAFVDHYFQRPARRSHHLDL
jgi:hypothetical protein